MPADIVNLRRHRKRRDREEKEKAAEANRLEFGRTKAEKRLTKTLNQKSERSLDQKRLQAKTRGSDVSGSESGGS